MKLAHDLAEDMYITSRLNNGIMGARKLASQFMVRVDLCLWNGEYKIVEDSCFLMLRTAFSLEGSDVLNKK